MKSTWSMSTLPPSTRTALPYCFSPIDLTRRVREGMIWLLTAVSEAGYWTTSAPPSSSSLSSLTWEGAEAGGEEGREGGDEMRGRGGKEGRRGDREGEEVKWERGVR